MQSAYMGNKSLTYEVLPRREEAARRVRLINGLASEDLKQTGLRLLGETRLKGTGQLIMVRNALAQIVARYAVQHIRPVFVTGLDPALSDLIGDYNSNVIKETYAAAGGYPMPSKMATVSQMCQRVWIAANDCAIVAEVGKNRILLKAVDPSVLEGEQAQDDPGQPVVLRWQRRRKVGKRWETVCDEWNISDPDNPTFRVLLTGLKGSDADYSEVKDITEKVFPKQSFAGKAYPWRWMKDARKGEPYIPARIYHAHDTGEMWTPYRGIEIVDGTLVAGVLWSFWVHCVFDASWPQRYGINVQLAGGIANADGSTGIVTDPATLLPLEPIKRGDPVVVDQFEPGADPEMLGKAIDNFCLQLEAQIVPVDIMSTGGDPLEQIARAREQVIAGYDLVCREGDGAILEICAAIANKNFNKGFAESGYGLEYRDEIDKALGVKVEEEPEEPENTEPPRSGEE